MSGYDFTVIRNVKACKKPHRCFWCAEKVKAGESSVRYSGVYEGDFSSFHFHPECWEASIQWQKENSPHYGELPDEGSMKRGLTDER